MSVKDFASAFNDYIPQNRKQLYFRIIDGHFQQPELDHICYRLHFLEEHFPPHKIDSALTWVIRHSNVGKQFIVWFMEECQGSDLEMHRKLLEVVNNENEYVRVLAGKNFKV